MPGNCWPRWGFPTGRGITRTSFPALDPELTGEVLRVLRDLAEHKTTMIIVTHEMKFARDVADRILFMDGGVVVEQGDAKQVIDHPQEERTRKFLASYGK